VTKLSARSLADVVTLGRRLSGATLDRAALGDEALMALRMPAAIGCLSHLTDAERDVAVNLLQALPQREIARRRGRSMRTVANQVASVYRKVGVHGRTEFVAYMRGGDEKAGARANRSGKMTMDHQRGSSL
jgi:DNA-binding NarL/FixJ family response regulator